MYYYLFKTFLRPVSIGLMVSRIIGRLIFLGGRSIIALQHCVSFFCTTKWISYMYTYIPSLLDLPPNPLHPTHLGHHRALSWAPCTIQQVPTSYLFYTWWCIYVNHNLPIHSPFPPPCFHTSVLYTCVFIPALQIGSSVPFF